MASPFRIFRKNQKTLMVAASVIAIFVFVLGDSLVSYVTGSRNARNADEHDARGTLVPHVPQRTGRGTRAPDPDEAGLLGGLLDEGLVEQLTCHGFSLTRRLQSQPLRLSVRWMPTQRATVTDMITG